MDEWWAGKVDNQVIPVRLDDLNKKLNSSDEVLVKPWGDFESRFAVLLSYLMAAQNGSVQHRYGVAYDTS